MCAELGLCSSVGLKVREVLISHGRSAGTHTHYGAGVVVEFCVRIRNVVCEYNFENSNLSS